MHHGVTIFPTEYTIRPGELARAAEERDFESLWVPEHSHLPVSPLTPGRGEPGLPAMYYELLDPFVALAAAAEATRRIRLGTSICLVAQRDPIQTAKLVASLDVLSGGRFLFGVGGGWNAPEMRNHGTPFEERLAILRERLEAMKAIWTQERAEYHGKHVDFGPMYAWPKPVQKPHPPIHVAANAPKGLGRVLRDGQGWFPIAGDGAAILEHLPELRRRARDSGRDPDAIEVTAYMCPGDPDLVRRFAAAGVHRVVYLLDPQGRDAVLRQLDALTRLR